MWFRSKQRSPAAAAEADYAHKRALLGPVELSPEIKARARLNAAAAVESVEFRRPWTIDAFVMQVSIARARPIIVLDNHMLIGTTKTTGFWRATSTADYIHVSSDVSPRAKEFIVLHELGHILCGHPRPVVGGADRPPVPIFDYESFPTVPADLIDALNDATKTMSHANPCTYSVLEIEAEWFALLASDRADAFRRQTVSNKAPTRSQQILDYYQKRSRMGIILDIGPWLFAILGAGVLTACYVAVLRRPRREPLGKRVALIALLIVTGRMLRAPDIQEPLDTFVLKTFGVHNAGYLLNQGLALLALTILLVLNSELLFPWLRTAGGHFVSDAFKAITMATIVGTLVFSDLGQKETEYLPGAYDGSLPQTVFFMLFGIICVAAGTVSLFVTIPGVRWTRGYLRASFVSYSLTMLLCILLGVHEWVFVFAVARNEERLSGWWYGRNSLAVAGVIMTAIFILFMVAVSTYSISALRARMTRYRALRAQLDTWIRIREALPSIEWSEVPTPGRSRLSCWRAAHDSITTYRMMIELSDADFIGSPGAEAP